MKNIVLYNDRYAANYVLSMRLKETFETAAVDIIEVTREDVLKERYPNDKTIAFILPGTPGGSSAYRDQLGEKGFKIIHKAIENGSTYLGFCAGAYLAATDFYYYNKYTGEIREIITPLPLIEGHARGPIAEYSDFKEKENPFADYALARIDFTNAHGEQDEAGIYYSCGPTLELYPEAIGDYEILARFNEIAGKPIAALRRKNIGRGDAILVSFPPEMGDINIQWINPQSPYKESGYDLVRKLHPWTESRKRFWDTLMRPILQKLENTYA